MRLSHSLVISSVAIFALLASGMVSVHAATISLSTSVLGPGTFNNGYNNNAGNSTVELIRSIAPSSSSPLNVAYTQGAPTIDFSPYVVAGATGGIFGSDQHGRAGVGPNSNLWIAGDGETSANADKGFGAHANWLITFDLQDIAPVHFGTSSFNGGNLNLTGSFGAHGGIGSSDPAAGVIQGAIFLDGVRIDSLAQTTRLGASLPFNLTIPDGGRWLTLAILNGNDLLGNSTLWDDAVFKNVNLTFAVPEPTTLTLLGLGACLLTMRRKRSRKSVH